MVTREGPATKIDGNEREKPRGLKERGQVRDGRKSRQERAARGESERPVWLSLADAEDTRQTETTPRQAAKAAQQGSTRQQRLVKVVHGSSSNEQGVLA